MEKGLKVRELVVVVSIIAVIMGVLIGIKINTYATNVSKKGAENKENLVDATTEVTNNKGLVCQSIDQSYQIIADNEDKVKTRANRFVQYFTSQQYETIIKMKEKNNPANEDLNCEMFQELYKKKFAGNKYIKCREYKYYGYSKEKGIHVIDVFIEGKYRVNKIQLSFDDSLRLKGFYCYSYSEPIPEKCSDYNEELVEIGKYKLKGLITLPNRSAKKLKPLVILVQSSGYNNADASIGENRMYANIAHFLAKEGVATLRYNGRLNQCEDLVKSTNSIYTELIDDAVSAVKQMSEDTRIDKNMIFVMGHDMGGMVMPKIVEKCPQVNGMISFAGTSRNYVDVMYDNNLLRFAELKKIQNQKEEEIANGTISEDEYNGEMNYVDENKNKLKVEFNNIKIIRNIKVGSNKIIQGFSESYWKSLSDLNVEATLNKINVPVLIMQGRADLIITEDRDFVEWQRMLDGKDNCTFIIYKGLNHMFMKTKGNSILDIEEEYMTKGVVDEIAIKDIVTFINDNSEEVKKSINKNNNENINNNKNIIR